MDEPILYTTLAGSAEAEFTEKKSTFIGHAAHVTTEDEARDFIKTQKSTYYDARHNVWAYVLASGAVRYSDDGEPQGTGGIPTLDVLRKSGVTDAVVVVTRYFGGILLGAGGLVRAYSHAASLAVEAAKIVTYTRYTELVIDCSYSDYQRYAAVLPQFGAVIDDTAFDTQVRILFAVKDEVKEPLFDRVREMSNGATVPTVRGHRFDFR